MKCEFCGRERVMPCRSTREMEEMQEYGSGDKICFAELMKLGGGEYTSNRNYTYLEPQRVEDSG